MSDSNTPDLDTAIDTVARHAIRNAVFDAIESGRIDWGDYPEIGENDWDAVTFRARTLADRLDRDREVYNAAYALLEKRAEGASGV